MFEWIRNEYRLRKMPSRLQRDVDSISGDTWYKNYQIKEVQGSNKSSLCNVKHDQEKNAKNVPEISEMFDDLDKRDEPSEANDKPTKHGINDENMKVDHLLPVSDHRELSGSNYSPNQINIEARLSAKQFLAKQQNAVHEIEMQHRHLDTDDGGAPSLGSLGLNGNQLRADTSSNSNFPFPFSADTSSGDMKRSSGQKQELKHFDDQLDRKKNDLFDEVDEKLSKKEQQGLVALHRVKRHVNKDEINRLLTNEKFNLEESLESHSSEEGN